VVPLDRVLLAVCSALVVGCYAVPPLRIGAGGGGALGQVVTREDSGERREASAAGAGQLRLAVAPIAGVEDRSGDFAFGWALDGTAGADGRDGIRHGPYLEVDWFALGGRGEAHQRWRLAPTLTLDTHVPTLDDDDEDTRADEMGDRGWGFGGSVGVLLEYIEVVRGRFLLGVAGGELGMGLGARVGVRHEDGGTHGYGLVSVEFRFPAAAGAVIPLRARTSLR
jgi:hypothetical protein